MSHEIKNQDDQAWVSIDSSLSMSEVKQFCDDIERLFRINPFLEFNNIKALETGEIILTGKNLSNDQAFDLKAHKQTIPNGYIINYNQGLKRSTTITINPTPNGTQIKILDDYSGISESERNNRLNEVDKSLTAWGTAIQKYLASWQRWSSYSLWRWYKQRIWLPMKPSARRISWMLINITALEFVAFLMVFTIFWLELDRYFGL